MGVLKNEMSLQFSKCMSFVVEKNVGYNVASNCYTNCTSSFWYMVGCTLPSY